jgi:asparagine synthase (glutamine-hydrolysing)
MCGICGFNWSDQNLINDMAEIISHRGPDQMGSFVDTGVSLGHRRLSIIDLSEKGTQPMHNEDESIYIVFNGEIYNFVDLRNELEQNGHIFKSNADTEVIVHAYEQWGTGCVTRLRGMFAFAIWDSNKKQFFLARDRIGIKPLYYYFRSNKFVFSSEIKSILLDNEIKREIDPESMYYFFGYEYVPAPKTMFKGINKLMPGQTLLLKDGKIVFKKYWNLTFSDTIHDEKIISEKMFALLKESVKLRLMSDVPLGAFLSGGIDSSAIVGLMSHMVDEPIKTFSIGYEDESFSEYEYARQISELFGTEHKEILVDPYSIDVFKKAVWHLDEPMSELSAVPVYLLCEEAKKDVTVCLSGEGGDELFAGYDRFVASKSDAYYRTIPGAIRKHIITRVVNKIPPQPQKKGLINIAKRFIEGSELPIEGRHMRWQYFSNEKEEQQLYSESFKAKTSHLKPFGIINDYYQSCSLNDRLAREQYAEINTYMVDDVLMKVDKMSMANSLEVRVPYLDHHFVELSASIPGNLKLKGFTTKYILKKTMSGLLPKNIIYRKKQGFSLPIKNWLRDELKEYMYDQLNNSEVIKDYFDNYYLNKLMEQHIRGTHNNSHRLWALMNLEWWYQRFFIDT